jgi:hypothetical protein
MYENCLWGSIDFKMAKALRNNYRIFSIAKGKRLKYPLATGVKFLVQGMHADVFSWGF